MEVLSEAAPDAVAEVMAEVALGVVSKSCCLTGTGGDDLSAAVECDMAVHSEYRR